MRSHKNFLNARNTTFRSISVGALMAALLMLPTGMAQNSNDGDRAAVEPGLIQLDETDVTESSDGGNVLIQSSTGPIGAPPGVIVAAPDEEVVIKAKKPAPPAGPKAPKGAPKMVIRHKQGEDSMERRMARLEQMVERLAEREQRLERFEGDFQRPELGKLQEDIERAARDADLAMRRFHRAGKGKDFVFEHKFALEGDVKMQRKALEAQRKAMEKHLEAIDKQLEKLDAAGQDAEVDTDVDVESDESKASPPPDSAP